ncbi:MAG: type II secretion system protein, partial [Planctomycetota bacterium]
MSRTTRAFTIIELLVVIAVIGVLSSILLPAVSNVRRTAARTQDQSNQRQLVLGAINYADTRKGQIMSGNTQRQDYFGSEQGNQTCDAWVNAQPENFDLDGDGLGDYF